MANLKMPPWAAYRAGLVSRALDRGQPALIRSRWRYTRAALIFAFLTAEQCSRHDPFCWLGLFCVASCSGLAARAWSVTKRQRRGR